MSMIFSSFSKAKRTVGRIWKRKIFRRYSFNDDIIRWRARKQYIIDAGKEGNRITVERFELGTACLPLIGNIEDSRPNDFVIARVDQDGLLASRIGLLGVESTIDESQFLSRTKFDIDIITHDGYVGVRKNFKGKKKPFMRELKALHFLALEGCNVPAILDVDFDKLIITTSYILGFVLREEMAKNGAILRDRDVAGRLEFSEMTAEGKRLFRINEGKRVLHQIVGPQFVETLRAELDKIHGAGFIHNDIKYGNIIIEKSSNKPYFIDFESAVALNKVGKRNFESMRNVEIEEFNLHFEKAESKPAITGRF